MTQSHPYDGRFHWPSGFGCFTWDNNFSELQGKYAGAHRGCHEDELPEALAEDALQPRSVWSTELPNDSILHRASA